MKKLAIFLALANVMVICLLACTKKETATASEDIIPEETEYAEPTTEILSVKPHNVDNDNGNMVKTTESKSDVVAVINEYYDGKTLYYSGEYTEKFDRHEIERIADLWKASGYRWVDTVESKADGIDVINLYFEKIPQTKPHTVTDETDDLEGGGDADPAKETPTENTGTGTLPNPLIVYGGGYGYDPDYTNAHQSHLNRSGGTYFYTDSNGNIWKETYYSSRVLYHYMTPQWTLRDDGVWTDSEGYIIVASSNPTEPFGTVVETSLGIGKVYDTGCRVGIHDVYVNW